MSRRFFGICAGFVLATALAGCSNSGSPQPHATTAPLPTLANPPTPRDGQPTVPVTPAGPSATPSRLDELTPQASETPATNPAAEREAVIEAATTILDAVYRSTLTLDSCLADNPNSKPCITLASDGAALQAGVAKFIAGFPEGGGFTFYMGRQVDGAWGFWFGTQQEIYQLVTFPGDLRACGGGSGVTIRADAANSAASAGSLTDNATVRAEEFRLTLNGSPDSGTRGEGWYRISGGTAGWIPASQAADASLGNCTLHDELEGSAPRG